MLTKCLTHYIKKTKITYANEVIVHLKKKKQKEPTYYKTLLNKKKKKSMEITENKLNYWSASARILKQEINYIKKMKV